MGGSEEAITSLGEAPSWGRGPKGHSQEIRSRFVVPDIGQVSYLRLTQLLEDFFTPGVGRTVYVNPGGPTGRAEMEEEFLSEAGTASG